MGQPSDGRRLRREAEHGEQSKAANEPSYVRLSRDDAPKRPRTSEGGPTALVDANGPRQSRLTYDVPCSRRSQEVPPRDGRRRGHDKHTVADDRGNHQKGSQRRQKQEKAPPPSIQPVFTTDDEDDEQPVLATEPVRRHRQHRRGQLRQPIERRAPQRNNMVEIRETLDFPSSGPVDEASPTTTSSEDIERQGRRGSNQSQIPLRSRDATSRQARRSARRDMRHRHLEDAEDDEAEEDGDDDDDPFLVEWTPGDPAHPRNWPKWKKWLMVSWACFMEFGISFASSAYSSASDGISEEFGVSQVVSTLGLTTFIGGLGVGALILAPTSENFGRNSTYFTSFFIFAIFQMPVALAPNIGTVLVSRFIAGFAGSVPLTVTGGTVGDVFAKDDSGMAVALFALAGTAGPAFGPIVCGWVSLLKGWRWVFWVNFIVWTAVWFGTLATLVETKADILIQKRAKAKRKETGDDRYYAEIEKDRRGYLEVFSAGVTRPLVMLATEATVIAMVRCACYLCRVRLARYSSRFSFCVLCRPSTTATSTVCSTSTLRLTPWSSQTATVSTKASSVSLTFPSSSEPCVPLWHTTGRTNSTCARRGRTAAARCPKLGLPGLSSVAPSLHWPSSGSPSRLIRKYHGQLPSCQACLLGLAPWSSTWQPSPLSLTLTRQTERVH